MHHAVAPVIPAALLGRWRDDTPSHFAFMRTPSEVIVQLARGPETLRALVADVPLADLKRRPRPEKWSAHEHACHLALVEPLWAERVERIVAEDVPTIVSYEPDADEPPDRLLGMDLGTALDAYERDRRTLLRRLEALAPADWERRAVNTAHARYSLFLMCRHAALHDMFHVYRVEESALGTYWPGERVSAGAPGGTRTQPEPAG